MSKRFRRPKQGRRAGNHKCNPNRPKSKNSPKGKRDEPKTGWKEYSGRRKAEGEDYSTWMRIPADGVREIMGIAPGTRDARVSAILCSVVKSNGNLSYWGLYSHFAKHPGDADLCGLKKRYSRSWYHLRISEIDPVVLLQPLPLTAGDGSAGNLLTNSSGFSKREFGEWHNAKHGDASVRKFCRLHIIHTPHGRICAATVTGGHASDSPRLREMARFLPQGKGYLIAGSAYMGKKNCQTVRDTGRRPVMRPKSNSRIKGFNALAGMLRFCRDHPGTFYRLVALRNNVESVFSSMKERFGSVVRAVRERAQCAELLSMAICYNMVA